MSVIYVLLFFFFFLLNKYLMVFLRAIIFLIFESKKEIKKIKNKHTAQFLRFLFLFFI